MDDQFFTDQDDNPLYEGGNVGIIEDPYGPNPQLIAATRPIPDSYPTELALSADGQYLYVSYQGLPVQVNPPDVDANGNLVLDANGFPVDDGLAYGGIMVFNAQQIVDAIENPNNQKYVDLYTDQLLDAPNKDTVPLLSMLGIDDLYVTPGATDLSGVYRTINTAIDIQAQYDQHEAYVYDNMGNQVYDDPPTDSIPATQTVFGIPDDDPHLGQSNPNGPIGLGVQPGGIATESGPAPQLTVLQPEPVATVATESGGTGSSSTIVTQVELVANNTIQITTTVDEINKTVSTSGGTFDFSLNIPAQVTFTIQNATTGDEVIAEDIPDPTDPTQSLSLQDFADAGISLMTGGIYQSSLSNLCRPGKRRGLTTTP